jgi:hypothetical protein
MCAPYGEKWEGKFFPPTGLNIALASFLVPNTSQADALWTVVGVIGES